MEPIINTLNQNNDNAHYQLNNNQIIGSWDQSKSASGIVSASSIDLSYKITVSLNPNKTFTYNERMSRTDAAVDPLASVSSPEQKEPGTISLGNVSKNTFSGKTFGTKQKGFEFHLGGKSGSNSYSYVLETNKIKQPLLNALKIAGYTEKKKSFFGKLFGK